MIDLGVELAGYDGSDGDDRGVSSGSFLLGPVLHDMGAQLWAMRPPPVVERLADLQAAGWNTQPPPGFDPDDGQSWWLGPLPGRSFWLGEPKPPPML